MSSSRKLKIGVIGPTGFGGAYLCVELLNRGHEVTGFSRHPEKLGIHVLYKPKVLDVATQSVRELAEAFKGLDVLVNEYSPHSSGVEALQYMPFVEITRKIVLAVRSAKLPYFVMVGGCGSLPLPGDPYETCLESEEWWLAYKRGMADSEAHTAYVEERLGSLGVGLRQYRNARILLKAGEETPESKAVIERNETDVIKNNKPLPLIMGCRATYLFFEGNTSFKWTFVSPPALYRSGVRTGKYIVVINMVPVKGDANDPTHLEGRLHGISAADLAIAIADDCETQSLEGKHWSAFGDISDQTPTPAYITLDSVSK